MIAQPNTTIWTLVKPVYWMLKFTGLAAFSIDGDIRDGRIKTTKWDILWMFLVSIGLSRSLYAKTFNDFSLSHTGSVLIDKGAYLVGIFNNFNVICGLFVFVVRRKTIWKIYAKLHKVDKKVRQ
jgi:7tm Chemosensory receptor